VTRGRADELAPRIARPDSVVTVGRFREGGPLGYRAATKPGPELRATRAEAAQDEVDWLNSRDGMPDETFLDQIVELALAKASAVICAALDSPTKPGIAPDSGRT
jgi:hypothetical protein